MTLWGAVLCFLAGALAGSTALVAVLVHGDRSTYR